MRRIEREIVCDALDGAPAVVATTAGTATLTLRDCGDNQILRAGPGSLEAGRAPEREAGRPGMARAGLVTTGGRSRPGRRGAGPARSVRQNSRRSASWMTRGAVTAPFQSPKSALFTSVLNALPPHWVEFPFQLLRRADLDKHRRRDDFHREQPVLRHQQEQQVQRFHESWPLVPHRWSKSSIATTLDG